MITPNDLEILIHYFVSANPHPRETASAVSNAITRYINDGIFEINMTHRSGYEVTDKGKAWLKTILAVPYPKKVWVDRDGNVIKT